MSESENKEASNSWWNKVKKSYEGLAKRLGQPDLSAEAAEPVDTAAPAIKAPAKASAAPRRGPKPTVGVEFNKLHAASLNKLGLLVGDGEYTVTSKLAVSYHGLETELVVRTMARFDALNRKGLPELETTDQVETYLGSIQRELAAKNQHALAAADGAMRALMERVISPQANQWAKISQRQILSSFTPEMPAPQALQVAQQLSKTIKSNIEKSKRTFLQKRCAPLGKYSLQQQSLRLQETGTIAFLDGEISTDLALDLPLGPQELDRLVDGSEEDFPNLIEGLFAEAKKAQLRKVEAQVLELSRRVNKLPHIELLSNAVIIETVQPYFHSTKTKAATKRAQTAIVAVEERAREAKYQDDLLKLNERRDAYADVASYYPLARQMQRQLVLYVGPTNSGKTWRSLNELAEAQTGVYLAPLRLLALEGQEELEKRGKVTSFLTGEERDIRPGASFTSSTIEMLNLEQAVDAVVVDEVQLLADERRGWAWLSAVVGAPAKKIIMTGSPDCVGLVKELASYLGEELVIHECQRYNELKVANTPMRLKDVRAGMAVVCFSRRDVLRIKATIEENSEHKVSVVYGNLSPQIRREEARRFRSGEAQVLVATDAIAMGLNLPIKEVCFYTTEKFNGEEMVSLPVADIRQIGGRAGRYGVADFGVVHALSSKSLEQIREAMLVEMPPLKPPFFVAPGRNHVRIISEVLGTQSLERILSFFERAIHFTDDRFGRSIIDDLSYLSSYVDAQLPFLSVEERLTIASAPVGIRNESVLQWFLERMLPTFPDPSRPQKEVESLDDLFDTALRFTGAARSQLQLRDAEDYLKALTLYAWLAYRFPKVFDRIEDCEQRRESVNAFIEQSLKGNIAKRCRSCGTKLAADFRFEICESCYGRNFDDSEMRRGGGGGGGRGNKPAEGRSRSRSRKR